MQLDIVFINKPLTSLQEFNFQAAIRTSSMDQHVEALLRHYYTNLDDFVRNLTEVASDGFGKPRPESDVRKHVLDVGRLYLVCDNHAQKPLVGFGSFDHYTLDGKGIIYLNGIVIRNSYQCLGLFSLLNKIEIKNRSASQYLVGRTQNPVIYHAMRQLVRRIAPNTIPIPTDLLEIAKYVSQEREMNNLDMQTLTGRGTYGECLYDRIPHNTPFRNFFDKNLKINYEAGDSVLLVGAFS